MTETTVILCPEDQHVSRCDIRVSWLTKSKAELRSNRTRAIDCPESVVSRISFKTLKES